MQKWTEEVLEPNKILFLCFSLHVYINFMTGPESSSFIVEFEFVDMFYSKFQLVSTEKPLIARVQGSG